MNYLLLVTSGEDNNASRVVAESIYAQVKGVNTYVSDGSAFMGVNVHQGMHKRTAAKCCYVHA
jgi:hypothetical protein